MRSLHCWSDVTYSMRIRISLSFSRAFRRMDSILRDVQPKEDTKCTHSLLRKDCADGLSLVTGQDTASPWVAEMTTFGTSHGVDSLGFAGCARDAPNHTSHIVASSTRASNHRNEPRRRQANKSPSRFPTHIFDSGELSFCLSTQMGGSSRATLHFDFQACQPSP